MARTYDLLPHSLVFFGLVVLKPRTSPCIVLPPWMAIKEEKSRTVLSQSSELRWEGHRIMVSTLKNYPRAEGWTVAPVLKTNPGEDLSHSSI